MISLLRRLAERDVVLFLEGGALRYSAPPGAYTSELREEDAAHRAEVIIALATFPSVPWLLQRHDAEELLVRLHADLIRIKHEDYGGTFPPVKASVIGLWIEVCEGYVNDHALEAARGWDAMELLDSAITHALDAACGRCNSESPQEPRRASLGGPVPVPVVPTGATIFCQDENGRPCKPEVAFMWTWEVAKGADRWWYAREHPVPRGHRYG